ncbi:hypothetical protein F5884DRAFT_673694 [Xylogone sp. PMI_703]|nr:hypothetical protein F5884DRAFT_673694 [Xylogone sp. PMI_703]
MFSGGEYADLITNPNNYEKPQNTSNIHHAPAVSNALFSSYHGSGTTPETAMGSIERNFSTSNVQHPYTDAAYHEVASMDNGYTNDLPVLSMESYDAVRAAAIAREQHETRVREHAAAPIPFGISDRPSDLTSDPKAKASQKRGKRDNSNGEEEQEASKKVRGRPRVDTRDETAADRRRTQIRMAQRAYRHRKESTITSLESRVEKLLKANEEMNAIFVALHDYAVSKGVLQREPEFGRELLSSTEKLLALAKDTSEENAKQDSKNDGDSEGSNHSHQDADPTRQRRGRPPNKKQRTEESVGQLDPIETTTSDNVWGGYIISHRNEKEREQEPEQGGLNFGSDTGLGFRHRDPQLEVISRPTEDNASFPFDFDFMDVQQYRVELPEDPINEALLPCGLPLPSSGAFSEQSFARRLHRSAIERGYLVLTSDNVSPATIQKVFGFCLLYETPDEIAIRLKGLIRGTRKDSLQNWRAPFYHVGENGTHYPQHEQTPNDESTLKYGNHGRSMGPFLPPISRFEDMYMNKTRCNLPGYEGIYYDPYDIEGILRTIGIDIPPAADFVTCELDMQSLVNNFPSHESPSIDQETTPRSKTFDDKSPRDKKNPTDCAPTLLPFPLARGFGDWEIDPPEKTSDKDIASLMPPVTTTDSDKPENEKKLVTINIQTLIESKFLSRRLTDMTFRHMTD